MTEHIELLHTIFAQGNPFRYQGSVSKHVFTAGHLNPTHIKLHLNRETTIAVEGHDQGSYTTTFLSWTTEAKGNIDYARQLITRLTEFLAPLTPAVSCIDPAVYTAYLFMDGPLGVSQASDIAHLVRYKVAPALSVTPHERSSTVFLPRDFIDISAGWEHGQPLDPVQVLTTTYPPDAILALKKPMPDLSLAEQAAINFKPDSIYPILLDWIKDNPGEAATPHRMTELYDILRGVAEDKGYSWNWTTTGALALHIASKFMREGLRKYLGMTMERRYATDMRDHRLWYSFRRRDMVSV